MILSFTAITFALFVAYIELTNLRIWIKSLKGEIIRTYSKANGIYQNPRSYQEWMRRNTIQRYK